jgi:hypothetical protein
MEILMKNSVLIALLISFCALQASEEPKKMGWWASAKENTQWGTPGATGRFLKFALRGNAGDQQKANLKARQDADYEKLKKDIWAANLAKSAIEDAAAKEKTQAWEGRTAKRKADFTAQWGQPVTVSGQGPESIREAAVAPRLTPGKPRIATPITVEGPKTSSIWSRMPWSQPASTTTSAPQQPSLFQRFSAFWKKPVDESTETPVGKTFLGRYGDEFGGGELPQFDNDLKTAGKTAHSIWQPIQAIKTRWNRPQSESPQVTGEKFLTRYSAESGMNEWSPEPVGPQVTGGSRDIDGSFVSSLEELEQRAHNRNLARQEGIRDEEKRRAAALMRQTGLAEAEAPYKEMAAADAAQQERRLAADLMRQQQQEENVRREQAEREQRYKEKAKADRKARSERKKKREDLREDYYNLYDITNDELREIKHILPTDPNTQEWYREFDKEYWPQEQRKRNKRLGLEETRKWPKRSKKQEWEQFKGAREAKEARMAREKKQGEE